MTRSVWMLVGVCGLGALLGWWLMGVLVGSGNERPALVPRIQSLPEFTKLPALAPGKRDFVDSIESPGATVWVLLGPNAKNPDSLALVCGFARGPAGAVVAPKCTPVAPELRRQFREAKFAAGGQEPLVLVPDPTAPQGVHALNARSGKGIPIESMAGGVGAQVERGTRLVRAFRLAPGSPSRLEQLSPVEGTYAGPVSGYAATKTPPLLPGGTSVSSCVTPAGYIQVHQDVPGVPALRPQRPIQIAFFSRGEVIAETSGQLPSTVVVDAPFACDATHALFTWLNAGGSLSELRCSPDGCAPTTVKQKDVADDAVLALARAGSSVVLLWRDKAGQPLVRLGPMDRFGASPTAPLFEAGPNDWQLVKVVNTGQSLLVFLQGQALKVIQIHADGRLEALAPSR